MSQTADPEIQAIVREAAGLIGEMFIHRRDAKAIYQPDYKGKWHWTAVTEPYTMGDFMQHLTGPRCLGTYLLNTDDTVKFMAFDIDLKQTSKFWKIYDIDQILDLEDRGYGFDLDLQEGPLEVALHDMDYDSHRWARIVILETIRILMNAVADQWNFVSMPMITGGGAHVLVPFPEPMPARIARGAAVELLNNIGARPRNDIFYDFGAMNEVSIEVFPKQDTLDGKSLGNLIRLPFGWHHEASIRTYAINPFAVTSPLWNYDKVSGPEMLRALAKNYRG